MPDQRPVQQDDLYRLLAAIKFLADDAEKRSNLVQSQLEIRDISIDQLLEHRDQAVMVLDLFKQFFKGCREVREEFEPYADKDWGVSDAQWFAQFVAEICNAAQDDVERIRALAAENAKIRGRLARIEASLNLPVANDNQ